VTDDTGDAFARMLDAMRDPDRTFTWEQMAYFMARERRWAYGAGYAEGYRRRTDDDNAAYPPEPYHLASSLGSDAVQVYRKRHGVDVVAPRDNDFPGLGMAAVERLRAESVE
jgi:hypothetical protein